MDGSLIELNCYSTSRFVDPFLCRLYEFECMVGDDGVSILYGDYLLNNKLNTPLHPGSKLMAVNSERLRFYLKSDYTAYQEAQEQERLERKAANDRATKDLSERLEAEAMAFNRSLNIPVQWSLVYKVVLSGLSQHGNGDGLNKRSVTHIQLLESLTDGRLKRTQSDLLCGANSGSFDLTAASETGKVTCRKCLELAKRWQGNAIESKQRPFKTIDSNDYSLKELLE